MITRETIDRIIEAARIEEVVGEFVALKRRGTNFIGLCPFHGENTPSFNVNPARNIYKCFGCGEGGNPINFVMKHESMSYPDALRYLANRYKIEVEETVPTPKELELQDARESLYILNSFAQKTFSEQLVESEEGKSIGLTYFKERGFTEETIHKFQLGYSFNDWNSFGQLAVKSGYQEDFLEKTGLCFRNDKGNLIDRFRGRVMFPIHNLTGRVIGFGGRILKKDDKIAKYLNSPESDIYLKSKSLYGIYFAKKAIVQKDVCYLVEGYTDVISMHQAGIENVVASSGTSLTPDQVRLIGRYTKNITMLFDGDSAGIKAAIRGIDIILQEGLNVKVVLFPDGDDPDSYAKKYPAAEVVKFIEESAKDFVVFKTGLLLHEVSNDPIRKANLIRDVVETIAKVPDQILRSMYVKKCSSLMEISEGVLLNELNKIKRQQIKKDTGDDSIVELITETIKPDAPVTELSTEEQEKNIIRLLLNFGHLKASYSVEEENQDGQTITVTYEPYVARYIVEEITMDNIRFENPVYDRILGLYAEQPEDSPFLDSDILLRHEDEKLRNVAIELLSPRYQLSENWSAKHGIHVPLEEHNLMNALEKSVFHLKKIKVMRMLEESRIKIKEAQLAGEDVLPLLEQHLRMEKIKAQISKALGIDILR
ncbi:MAG: hypothetical protein RIQ47_1025 [Bacteroidota bacterium]|jgi:DNA primase